MYVYCTEEYKCTNRLAGSHRPPMQRSTGKIGPFQPQVTTHTYEVGDYLKIIIRGDIFLRDLCGAA